MLGVRKRTWAEINLDAAAWNFRQIRQAVREESKVCCVIKANAYGHNAVRLAQLYESMGADFLAVSNPEEALGLRQEKITLPILILGYTPPDCAGILARQNISQCVYSLSYAKALSEAAESEGVQVKMHIKIDSGMGRIGFQHRNGHSEMEDALAACRLPGLVPEGIFTHFAVADDGAEGEAFTAEQYRNFIDAIEMLKCYGIQFALRHCANSAAIFDKPVVPDYPDVHLDMVRAGVVLYGLAPSMQTRKLPELRPVMALKSIVSHIKTIQPGDTVSYGRTYEADSPRRVATVPIGYADGFWRSNSGHCKMLVKKQLCPLIGRVCMDQLMLDITDTHDIHEGDIVTVFGDADGLCSADGIAEQTGTINYEVVCAVGERVPRFFLEDGLPVDVSDNIWKR
ncbi:MAG: alanine racemase [Oscillospiraceae bacterium]|nr:alanine racemase [Oscillospiraceae bacterium]